MAVVAAGDQAVAFAGLTLTVQRIALAAWVPGLTLRSWGAAPLAVAAEGVLVPCGADEALWVGGWVADRTCPAGVAVTDPETGQHGSLDCPGAFQLTSLANGAPAPIRLAPPATARLLRVEARGPGRPAAFTLRLMTPGRWSAATGRPAPAPLAGPPPLPPRLG